MSARLIIDVAGPVLGLLSRALYHDEPRLRGGYLLPQAGEADQAWQAGVKYLTALREAVPEGHAGDLRALELLVRGRLARLVSGRWINASIPQEDRRVDLYAAKVGAFEEKAHLLVAATQNSMALQRHSAFSKPPELDLADHKILRKRAREFAQADTLEDLDARLFRRGLPEYGQGYFNGKYDFVDLPEVVQAKVWELSLVYSSFLETEFFAPIPYAMIQSHPRIFPVPPPTVYHEFVSLAKELFGGQVDMKTAYYFFKWLIPALQEARTLGEMKFIFNGRTKFYEDRLPWPPGVKANFMGSLSHLEDLLGAGFVTPHDLNGVPTIFGLRRRAAEILHLSYPAPSESARDLAAEQGHLQRELAMCQEALGVEKLIARVVEPWVSGSLDGKLLYRVRSLRNDVREKSRLEDWCRDIPVWIRMPEDPWRQVRSRAIAEVTTAEAALEKFQTDLARAERCVPFRMKFWYDRKQILDQGLREARRYMDLIRDVESLRHLPKVPPGQTDIEVRLQAELRKVQVHLDFLVASLNV